jgi:hypothetical protein
VSVGVVLRAHHGPIPAFFEELFSFLNVFVKRKFEIGKWFGRKNAFGMMTTLANGTFS